MVGQMDLDGSPVAGSTPAEARPKPKEKSGKKSLKRKRVSIGDSTSKEERESHIAEFRREIESLFVYFREVLRQRVSLEDALVHSCNSTNSFIACLLEESSLPFSKLVEEIYEKLKTEEGITVAWVRSKLLFVGQRMMYGAATADADVLEDDSETCLWCWETRDMKLLPKFQVGVLNIRRTCRKKIHERITALSAMVSALSSAHHNNKTDIMKATEMLGKTLNEVQIRSLVENLLQKNGANLAEKEAKLKEKEVIKELERHNREAEKEKKRVDRELQKEKLQCEKEQKRLQEEAEKEERRREKEEADMKKQFMRQQEEIDKEQRRREKEEAELKKQLAIQKQATMMERFLKREKNNASTPVNRPLGTASPLGSSGRTEETLNAVTYSMDPALFQQIGVDTHDLLKSHMGAWRKLNQSINSRKSQHWGIRRKPKTSLVKELKLQGLSSEAESSVKVMTAKKDGLEESFADDSMLACHNTVASSSTSRPRNKKLLQFDKSHRPAYYGTMFRKSDVVGPRCPLKKDPNLEYDIDSDEEWEEEEPGESLSDCDKDEEEEALDEENCKGEEHDGSEDSFMVPDGYLSEDEGVQLDSMPSDSTDEVRSTSTSCKQEVENEEFNALIRNQKYLNNVTNLALRKNQPVIISNLMYEKSALVTAQDLSGTCKLEQICLQALCIRPYYGNKCAEISMDHTDNSVSEDLEVSQSMGNTTPPPVAGAVMSDTDLPKIVKTIQSCSRGMNKVLESLQLKFPSVPKTQLRNKVREIADFADNRWQVKGHILSKLGLSTPPGKGDIISMFFKKRCIPSSVDSVKAFESSPPSPKPILKAILPDDNGDHLGKQL